MFDSVNTKVEGTDKEVYESLINQVDNLLQKNEPILSALSNLSAALYFAFDKIDWAGFYISDNNKLFLGPFQGKPACVEISMGKGVCGTSAESGKTIIVDDVDTFPGHIACDALSKSEIVIPIIYNDKVFGVLDLDSYKYSAFNDTDKFYLEKIINGFINKFDLENFILK